MTNSDPNPDAARFDDPKAEEAHRALLRDAEYERATRNLLREIDDVVDDLELGNREFPAVIQGHMLKDKLHVLDPERRVLQDLLLRALKLHPNPPPEFVAEVDALKYPTTADLTRWAESEVTPVALRLNLRRIAKAFTAMERCISTAVPQCSYVVPAVLARRIYGG